MMTTKTWRTMRRKTTKTQNKTKTRFDILHVLFYDDILDYLHINTLSCATCDARKSKSFLRRHIYTNARSKHGKLNNHIVLVEIFMATCAPEVAATILFVG